MFCRFGYFLQALGRNGLLANAPGNAEIRFERPSSSSVKIRAFFGRNYRHKQYITAPH